MKREILMFEAPVDIGELNIIPVVSLSITSRKLWGVLSYSANKEPLYVVLSYRGESKALDMLGKEVPIDQMKSELSARGSDQIEIPLPQQLTGHL
jgi:hypothetical protein